MSWMLYCFFFFFFVNNRFCNGCRTCRVYELDTRKPGGAAGSGLSVTFVAKISRAHVTGDTTSANAAGASATPPSSTDAAASNDDVAAYQHTNGNAVTAPEFYLFQDESLASFFRRLAFSPDGNLLVAPAGQYRTPSGPQNTVYVFARNQLTK